MKNLNHNQRITLITTILYLNFIFLFLTKNVIYSEEIEGRIRMTQNQEWIIETSDFKDEYLYIAKAFYNNSLEEIGWDTLSISTNSNFSDEIQAEAAGRLEASLTKERIWNHYQNVKEVTPNVTQDEFNFFKEQEEFLLNKTSEFKKDFILYNAYLIYLQFKGLREQYNNEVTQDKMIENEHFHIMSSFGELFDIKNKYNNIDYSKKSSKEIMEKFLINNHCSVMYKIKDDFSDIFAGHNTWYYYPMMTRIFKEYNFNFNHPSIKAKNTMFSSYPATLTSNDDFFLTSQNLLILETTISNYNKTANKLIDPKALLCWERVQIANRISDNPKEWVQNFMKYNSGTFNNQYSVLDVKKIDTQNKVIKPEILYIVEQMPGFIDYKDVSDELKFGYFPSFNIPYIKNIRDYSNLTNMLKEKEDLRTTMDYDINPRAKIMRRDHKKINDTETMKLFMLYNDYKNDLFSLGDPSQQIASRADLRTNKSYCFGSYDVKFVVASELKNKNKKIHLFGGPTNQQKDFDFDEVEGCKKYKHIGIKSIPKYEWIIYENRFKFYE